MECHEAAGVDGVLRVALGGVAFEPRQAEAVPVRRPPRHRAHLPGVVLHEPPANATVHTVKNYEDFVVLSCSNDC